MLLSFAIDLGEVMLRNGAETHRVEDTLERILSVSKDSMPETFVTPTGIFASIQSPLYGGTITKFKRISERSINLEKVTKANSLSRNFVEGKISLVKGFDELEKIDGIKPFNTALVLLMHGLVCFAFALLFNGCFTDGLVAFAVGVLLGITNNLMSRRTSPFLASLIGGASITIYTMVFYCLGMVISYETVITGSIMPLVPGVAITNAVRDIMNGDFLSGASRVTEAIITAVAVAASVGVVLSVSSKLGVI